MKHWKEFVLLLSTLIICILLGEVGLRILDGYSLAHVSLIKNQIVLRNSEHDERVSWEHAREKMVSLPVAETTDRKWFDLDPPRISGQVDKYLAERYWSKPALGREKIYEWNHRFVVSSICKGEHEFDVKDVFVFDAPRDESRPRFRYPPSKTLPTGLTTNAFGWRGPKIQLNRLSGVVRIAFVGASTTVSAHGLPFSYPEYVGNWLNIWAKSQGLPLKFEIINAGREGTSSDDFAAIVRDELLPVDPDVVVYYEGANQFWPSNYVEWPTGGPPAKPKQTFKQPSWGAMHSAFVRRAENLLDFGAPGSEPEKPHLNVKWPSYLDEFNPQPRGHLPLNLDRILADMRNIKENLSNNHATLAISSFVWLAYPGMRLELPRQQGIYDFLNSTYWPFTYAHIRRMADFQNRVFRNFAESNGLPFLDVAADYPQDPELFRDAIHQNEAGIKLRGWIMFQKLVPILRAQIAKRALPRPSVGQALKAHPMYAFPVRLLSHDQLKSECPSSESKDKRRIADLATMQRVVERYKADTGHYPAPLSGRSTWGQCSSSNSAQDNWLPNGNDYKWSRKYISVMPQDPATACNYPFDRKTVGHAQYVYYTDGHHYAFVAGLEDASLPGTIKNRGDKAAPAWFRKLSGMDQSWWPGTLIVTGGE